MEGLSMVLSIVYILVCVAIVIVVLMQESKNQGLSGAIAGGASTYWSKNKGRTKEGMLNKLTIILGIVFIVLSIVLNFSSLQ